MSESLTEAQLNRLSRTILNSPSAFARKDALVEIYQLKHDGLGEVLRQAAAQDQDSEVRELAQNLLRMYESDQALKPGSVETPAAQPASRSNTQPDHPNPHHTESKAATHSSRPLQTGVWLCIFCGADNSGASCTTCGRERSLQHDVEPEVPQQPGSFSDVFLLHPSNANFLHGQPNARLSSGRSSRLILLPVLAITLFVMFLVYTEWRTFYMLSTTGQLIQGQYTGKRSSMTDNDSSPVYYAGFRYEVDGQSFEGDHQVIYELYERIETGAPVSILYAPSDPSIARIEEAHGLYFPAIYTLIIILLGLAGWRLFNNTVIGRRQDVELARDGRLVRGELVSISGRARDDKSRYRVTAKYRFQPPDGGEPVVATWRTLRPDLRRTGLPEAGRPVMVLYKNRKLFRML